MENQQNINPNWLNHFEHSCCTEQFCAGCLFFFFSKCSYTMRTQPGHQYVQHVLRCYVLSASFPNGTDSSYCTTVALQAACLKPAEEILFKYFSLRNDETKYERIQPCHQATLRTLTASANYAQRDPKFNRFSKKKEIDFAIFVVVYTRILIQS